MIRTRVVIDRAEVARTVDALAAGLANLALAIEAAAKANAPVRGGHRSFAPGGPVGGALRRSIHWAVYRNGRRVGGTGPGRGAGGRFTSSSVDENGRATPRYAARQGIEAFVGTNIDYGRFVHDGTARMRARPFLTEAYMEVIPEATRLIGAGARRYLGRAR